MPGLLSLLRRTIRRGHLRVVDWNGRSHDIGEVDVPAVVVSIPNRATAIRLAVDPHLALGESYVSGQMLVEGSIVDLLEILAKNTEVGAHGLGGALAFRMRGWLMHIAQNNTVSRAQRNAAHHYDLPVDFYRLFLDHDLQYSCAFYDDDHSTLELAQLRKKELIAAKLNLSNGMRVLDIGSGYGGLALFLARQMSADVTGVTLSKEQLRVARERSHDSPKGTRVRFDLKDYRHVAGVYDRVVSIGMLEHVGYRHYTKFFQRVATLLNETGVALIHSIGRALGGGTTNPWVAKYIFPGGYTPALSELVPAIEAAGLYVTDLEVLRGHYARTLADWRSRLTAAKTQIVTSYGEAFYRKWEFYLAGAEMGFRYQGLVVFQLQLAKRPGAVPVTRDYIFRAMRAKDS